MTTSLKEAFNEKWKANISKISNPSKDTQNILSAIKNSVLEFIPALIGELEEAKREILGLQEELREIKSNSPGPSTDSESDPKEIFSTRYACNAEVRRVQNTLIVEFREGHVLGKGKNLPGADFIKDINNEMAEKNAEYKENLLKVENFVLAKWLQDQTIIPGPSAHFGFYLDGQVRCRTILS